MRSVGRVLFALFAAAPAQAHNEAAPMGQKVLVTKVVTKGTSRIEFQLGSGSYGTFGAWASSSWTSSVARAEETAEEKDLKERIRQMTDRDMKNRLEKELNGLRSERERGDCARGGRSAAGRRGA
jgi:hypothetical protein